MVKEFDVMQFDAALAEKKTMVVDFWAVWCGPCRMLAPIVEQLSGEYEGKVEFVKVDVDENMELAQRYSIVSIPCVMVFKNGEAAGRSIGYTTKDSLKAFIDQKI